MNENIVKQELIRKVEILEKGRNEQDIPKDISISKLVDRIFLDGVNEGIRFERMEANKK